MTNIQIFLFIVLLVLAYGWGKLRGRISGEVFMSYYYRTNTVELVRQALLELKVEHKLKEYDSK